MSAGRPAGSPVEGRAEGGLFVEAAADDPDVPLAGPVVAARVALAAGVGDGVELEDEEIDQLIDQPTGFVDNPASPWVVRVKMTAARCMSGRLPRRPFSAAVGRMGKVGRQRSPSPPRSAAPAPTAPAARQDTEAGHA